MILAPTRLVFELRTWCLATAVFLVLAGTGCSQKEGAPGAGAGGRGGRGGPGGAAPVIVDRATPKVVPLVIDAIGNVEPMRSAAIRAQITGTVFKIDIREGQDVAEGDLLLEIDPRPFENALKSALADQKRIHVQLDAAHSEVARYKSLPVGSMISQEQLQQVQDNAAALEAQAAASEATVATARLNLSYCSVRAPIAGRTGNLNVHEGDMIRANDTAALLTINQLSPIYVTFGVAQRYLASIAKYRAAGTLHVEAAPSGGDDQSEHGQLTFVDNTVDPTTGTIKLKATFPNQDHRLWPGLFTGITVTLATPEGLTVPASAIQTDQAGQHVFVVKPDNTAEFRSVQVERTFEDVAVVTKGLSPGETVVIDGQLRVIPGRPVQIKPPETLTHPEAIQAGTGGGDSGRTHQKGKGKKQGT